MSATQQPLDTPASRKAAIARVRAAHPELPSSSSTFRAKRRIRELPVWAELMNGMPGSTLLAVEGEGAASSTARGANAGSGGRKFGPNYVEQEETIRNDHSAHFVDTAVGSLPGNAVRNGSAATRFVEYPKLRRLVQTKVELVQSASIPPTYLCADLRESLLSSRGGNAMRVSSPSSSPEVTNGSLPDAATSAVDSDKAMPFSLPDLLPVKYDVIVVDPPLEAYEWEEAPKADVQDVWSWADVSALPIPKIAAKESFIFLWVGSGAGDGLERGREVLMRWGYRRCEDITWVQTNSLSEDTSTRQQPSTSSVFARSVQHCLMGIRGTVRRSNDTNFVHCNVDTDVILWEGEQVQDGTEHHNRATDSCGSVPRSFRVDARAKPPELYTLIENFCLGTRRLELFGRNRNLRRGWLTIGTEVGPDAAGWSGSDSSMARAEVYQGQRYTSRFARDRPNAELGERLNILPHSAECDALRPKTPPLRNARGVPNVLSGRGGGQVGHGHVLAHPLPSGLSNRTLPGWSIQAHPQAVSASMLQESFSSQQRAHPTQQFHQQMPPQSILPPIQYGYSNAGLQGVQVPAAMATINNPYAAGHARPPRPGPGGAGLSGLGAGGPRTMSVPSGSETLSGPQASVLQQMRGTKPASSVPVTEILPHRTASVSPPPKQGEISKPRVASE